MLCTFWLRNVLRATTACNFSSLICPARSAPAALASLLFDPREPQIIGKTQCFATFLPFRAPGSSFFWDFLFLTSFFFSSLLFFDSYHLCFSSVHIVGSLTSKLPSTIVDHGFEFLPCCTHDDKYDLHSKGSLSPWRLHKCKAIFLYILNATFFDKLAAKIWEELD